MPPDKHTGASLRVGPFQEKKDEAGFKREKNWGFVEEEGALLVYYALLPCTVELQFDTTQPDGVSLPSRTCYNDKAAIILQQTGKFSQGVLVGVRCLPAQYSSERPEAVS
jgi:hypothetical protein